MQTKQKDTKQFVNVKRESFFRIKPILNIKKFWQYIRTSRIIIYELTKKNILHIFTVNERMHKLMLQIYVLSKLLYRIYYIRNNN